MTDAPGGTDWTEQGAVPVEDRPTAEELEAHRREHGGRPPDVQITDDDLVHGGTDEVPSGGAG
jgi:hypothetical protein